jgi:hypothetical protein
MRNRFFSPRRKILKKFIFPLLLLTGFLCLGNDLPEPQGPVSVERAKQIIKNWAGRKNLAINLEGSSEGYPGSVWWNSQCYSFRVEDPNPDHKYTGFVYVDSFKGVVVGIEGFRIPPKAKRLIKPAKKSMISPDEAIKSAKIAIKSYFPNVPIDSFSIDTSPSRINNGRKWKEKSDSIRVEFYNTAVSPFKERVWIQVQSASTLLDAETGECRFIFCVYEPLEIPPLPRFNTEQAIDIAISFLNGMGAEFVEIEEAEKDWWLAREEGGGPQRIVKQITLHRYPSKDDPGEGGGVILLVDGRTGEICRWICSWCMWAPIERTTLTLYFKGSERKWKSQPIIKEKEIFISTDDIKAMGFKLERTKDGLILCYKKKRAEIPPDALLKAKGKDYIKSSVLEKIKGIKAKYFAQFNILHIWEINELGYEQGIEELLKKKIKECRDGSQV